VDRHWLLTWTTYGTWLPGDARGSHVRVADTPGRRTFELVDGDTARAIGLRESARARLKRQPIWLTAEQARVVFEAIEEQAAHRGWASNACAVMANHVHVVVGVPGDPEPARILHGFKAYASRALNQRFRQQTVGTWWTQSGSTRLLRAEPNVIAALRYVRDQPRALAVRLHATTWEGRV
jgi:REP element-mobilizing transposase RayT